jgi:hypothetical protein
MKIDELKQRIEKCRSDLKQKDGRICSFSETGPVNIGLIDAIAEVLEVQERRIKELENRMTDS